MDLEAPSSEDYWANGRRGRVGWVGGGAHGQGEGGPRVARTYALVLATARETRAKVPTGDRHFKGLPEAVWLAE